MSEKRIPVIGSPVHYHSAAGTRPQAATVCHVDPDKGTVNVCTMNENGQTYGAQEVPIVEEWGAIPAGHFAVWPPEPNVVAAPAPAAPAKPAAKKK